MPGVCTGVGPEIKRLRLAAGLTQRQACREIWGSESSQAMWSRWERGVQRPYLGALTDIARYFGVPLETFGLDTEHRALTDDDIEAAHRMLDRARQLVEAASAILARAGRP